MDSIEFSVQEFIHLLILDEIKRKKSMRFAILKARQFPSLLNSFLLVNARRYVFNTSRA